MYSNFKTSSDYPILIWVDKQMFNQENQLICKQLLNDYQYLFQAFDNLNDALRLLQQIGDKDITIITSGQFAYDLVKYSKQNLVIFCGNKYNHFDLFINNHQIKALVSSSFQLAHENAILCMNQTDIYNDFLKLLSPQQQQIEYYHSKDYVSIQFLVVIEEIRKNKELKEEQVFTEIDSLLAISKKENKKQIIFQDLEQKEKQKYSKKFSLFEKLIYLYSREEIYQTFNYQFAKHNYQEIKNIILCLYQGFKEQELNQKYYKNLYRGISIDSQDTFEQIVQDLYQNLCEGSSLFWNTMTSTSLSFDVAKKFSQQSLYGIFYQIELDDDVPYPCFKLENYHSEFPNEQEVLLFPQFQFIIQDIEYFYHESKKQYIVFVKQVKNNYAFALDPKLRKIYWDSVIQEKIKPKIETLVNFHSKRIFEITQFFAEQQCDLDIYQDEILDRVEKELQNIFKQIQFNLTQILRHSSYKNILNHINKLTQVYLEIIKLKDQIYNPASFFQQIEEQLDQVMKSLRQNIGTLILKGIINIEYQKEYLQNLQNKFKEKMKKQQTIQLGNTQESDTLLQKSQPIYNGKTAGLTYQQLKAQKITSLQQMQHKNGNLAYEATLQDGNKLLMHHNPNNNNELTFSKKIDANGKNGYSNKWEKVGKPIKTEQVTVQEVQQSIKGQNQKFNVNNVKAIETNYQFQQARINGQIGGIIAGTVGSLTVDCIMDGVNKEKLGKGLLYSASVQGGIMYAQSIQSLGKVVPYVGIGFTALMTSISVGGIILSDFLTQSEKVYNSILIALKTGSAIGLGFLGIEGGMALGAVGGPVGVVIGGILGGFIGGASGNLLGRAIDYYTQFNLEVSFQQQNKSTLKDGYLINPGILPKITWKQVKEKVKSLILIAQTDSHLACIIPNIDKNKTYISENEDIGILFNQYKYIGPDDSCDTITFRLLATSDEYVNEDEILQQLQANEINIIDFATVKINLKNIK
ncbi:unnamed protein product [Paramecium sonneborni]|uniref:Uncharacterized protein n=1 Tax=Paramecium sonneborni TaxID=65129 RepID=A0A8S1QYR3_9CILI|nr:unnamed protein product [Paramecium sonneborni]